MKRLFLLVFAIFMAFLGCSNERTINVERDSLNLSGDWKIYYADRDEFKNPDFDDSNWQTVSIPGFINSKKEQQFFWLRKDVTLDDQKLTSDLAFVLGKIWDVEETYFNGEKIGKGGEYYPHFNSNWNKFRYYYIPDNLKKKNSVIAIKVFSNSMAIYNGEPLITNLEHAKEITFYRQMVAEYIPFGLALFVLLLGFILYWQYFFYRKEKIYLYFTTLSVLSFFMLMHYFFPYWRGVSYNFRDNFYYVITAINVCLFYFTIEALLDTKIRLLRLLFTAMTIGMIVVCATATPTDPITGWRFNVYTVYTVLFCLMFFILLFKGLKEKKQGIAVLFVGFFLFLFSTIHDGFVISHFIYSDFYYNSMGISGFLICIGALLSWRNACAEKSLDDYSKNLEKKVVDRTKALQLANEKVTLGLRDLAATYDIMEKDMAMAVNVQKSFIKDEYPALSDWDLAFCFQPKSGVSGDFYDYYMLDDKLIGVSLLDVSGHGISSGILTLVAKNIAERKMLKEKKSLGEIVGAINKELIIELDNIEKYITGIFLGINGNEVEYVNAGHTELLLKRFGREKSFIVKSKTKEEKGMFLGIGAMEATYKSLKFSLDSGDFLVLYTDCLNESENAKHEAWGVDGILNAMDTAPGDSAQEILDHLLAKLHGFVGNKELVDDLTVLVVRKK